MGKHCCVCSRLLKQEYEKPMICSFCLEKKNDFIAIKCNKCGHHDFALKSSYILSQLKLFTSWCDEAELDYIRNRKLLITFCNECPECEGIKTC